MLRRPVSPRLKERFFHKKIYKKNVSPQHIKKTIFGYTINMSNPQQNNIHNEIKQIKKETDSLQDRLKKNDKSQNAHRNNTSTKRTKDACFSNQKITKYSEEYILK